MGRIAKDAGKADGHAPQIGWRTYETSQEWTQSRRNREWQERRARMQQAEKVAAGVKRILATKKQGRSERAEGFLKRLRAETNRGDGGGGGGGDDGTGDTSRFRVSPPGTYPHRRLGPSTQCPYSYIM